MHPEERIPLPTGHGKAHPLGMLSTSPGPRTHFVVEGDGTRGVELNFYDGDERLTPLRYSDGRDQMDVVSEVLEAFESSDLVWLDGKVGSGKSVIGLRAAIAMGGGVVSVPTNALSDQYHRDYFRGDKYFLKGGGDRARISVFKGRGNFTCPYKEADGRSTLGSMDLSCSDNNLPCTRELANDESRLDALDDCDWAGTVSVPGGDDPYRRGYHAALEYEAIEGERRVLLKGPREEECPYWSQYRGYADADVLVMNGHKFRIETEIGRLPEKPLVVIDEADHFLDSLTNEVTVTDRKITTILNNVREELEDRDTWGDAGERDLQELLEEISGLRTDLQNGRKDPLRAAKLLADMLHELDPDPNSVAGRLHWDLKSLLEYEGQIEYEEDLDSPHNPRVTYFVPDPSLILNRLLDTLDAKVLMMSATKPSTYVLEEVFGIDPPVVRGETEFPGTVVQRRTGRETTVTASKYRDPSFRENYERTRNVIFTNMDKPGFVPVHAYKYGPDGLRDALQDRDSIEQKGVTFSTTMDRGSDLDHMDSVAVLKYPLPNIGDPYLQALKKRLGDDRFWKYVDDQARRELIQQVGRITRNPDTVVEFWSPDQKAHRKLRSHWNGRITTRRPAR